MATIDECIEFALTNIGLWWRYGISRHCDEWKYIVIGRIFESEFILIPPSLKISESSSNGSYRNTDEVWWRYGISRSCDECFLLVKYDKLRVYRILDHLGCYLYMNITYLFIYISDRNIVCTFSRYSIVYCHCVVCPSSIYGFWLPLWYLQTLLILTARFCLWNYFHIIYIYIYIYTSEN